MNLSLEDLGLELLLVPQFTLAADTRGGRRASFSAAADADTGLRFFEMMLALARERLPRVASGTFGAAMQVALVNDGPVTFWLES
jgi:D-tyrosyl-tRNA(Tyr) deacylase